MRRHVLVTRPEPGLSETMEAVADLGFEPVASPLLHIAARRALLPGARTLAALLLTSGQAVAPLADAARRDPALRALPLFAVGDSTAARARDAGFARTLSARGDARDLAGLAQEAMPAAFLGSEAHALLLATGAGQGNALAGLLRARGARVQRRVVYEALPVRRLPEAALKALGAGKIAACLFFSAETARNFGHVCPVALHPALNAIHALAISPAVGAALTGLPWRSVRIARHPDAEAMLALLAPGTHLAGAIDDLSAQS